MAIISINPPTEIVIDTNLFSKKAYNALMLTRCLDQYSGGILHYYFDDIPKDINYVDTRPSFKGYEALWHLIDGIYRDFTNGSIKFLVKAPSAYERKISTTILWNNFTKNNRMQQMKEFVLPLKKTLAFLKKMQKSEDEVVLKSVYTAPFKPHKFHYTERTEDNIYRMFGIKARPYFHDVYKSTYNVLIDHFSGMPIEDLVKKFGEKNVYDVIGNPLDPFAASKIKDVYEEQDRLCELGKQQCRDVYDAFCEDYWESAEVIKRLLDIFNDIESRQKALEDSIDL